MFYLIYNYYWVLWSLHIKKFSLIYQYLFLDHREKSLRLSGF